MVLLGENFSFDDVKHIVMLNGKRRSLKDTHKQGCHFIFLIYLKHFFCICPKDFLKLLEKFLMTFFNHLPQNS